MLKRNSIHKSDICVYEWICCGNVLLAYVKASVSAAAVLVL